MSVFIVIEICFIIYTIGYYRKIKNDNIDLSAENKYILGIAIFFTICCFIALFFVSEVGISCSLFSSFFYLLFRLNSKTNINAIAVQNPKYKNFKEFQDTKNSLKLNSNQLKKVNKEMISSITKSIKIKSSIEPSKVFDDNYLNFILEDGLTVKEHMEQDYVAASRHANSNYQKQFNNTAINKQYDFVVNNIHNRSKKYEINKFEEIFIKQFLTQISTIRKKYWVTLDRYGDGELMFYYNSYIVGRVHLRDENSMSMQILTPSTHKNLYNITFQQCLDNIKKWCNYIKYHLRESRI